MEFVLSGILKQELDFHRYPFNITCVFPVVVFELVVYTSSVIADALGVAVRAKGGRPPRASIAAA